MDAINNDACYPEGPLWHRDRLWYVEYGAHRIMGWNGRSNDIFWQEAGSGPCALAAWGEDLLLCAFDGNALLRIGADGTTRARWDRDIDGNGFVGPNDLTPDGHGGFFFTASGRFDIEAPLEGALLHFDPRGQIRLLAEGLHFPNGIAFDAARRRLYVSEHLAQRILMFDMPAFRHLGAARVFCRLGNVAPHELDRELYAGGDGMELDSEGRLHVAHFGTGRLLTFEPDGRLAGSVDLPMRYPTNLAFGPSNGNAQPAIYVTAVADPWHVPYPGAVFHLNP
ncbi:MAG: SMP-30/gluconolactonase/LRE family protein [Dongiaceae bacterium]